MSNNNGEMINDMLKSLSQKLGTNSGELKQAAQKNDFSSVLKNMNANDARKIQEVLSNKEQTQRILSSPQAQNILKKLLGDQKNG